MKLSLLIGIFLLFALGGIAQAQTVQAREGALCLIRSDSKLVLVEEILTRRLSLPGGTIEQGESPQLTAQRETWEETGLAVHVGKLLGKTESAYIYDCTSQSDITAFEYNNRWGGYVLPIWFAPHYGIDIASAMLIDPTQVVADDYRYPGQWPQITLLLRQATSQPVMMADDLIANAPPIYQAELSLVTQIQSAVADLPAPLNTVLSAVLIFGSQLASLWAALIFFPLIFWYCGRTFCNHAFFAVSVTAIFCIVAQQGFALPRPHVYFPQLDLINSYGFSFPNLPVAIWTCLGVMLLYRLELFALNRYLMLLTACIVWLAAGQYYVGAAFGLDLLVGLLLGALMAWHIIRLEISPHIDADAILSSPRLWLVMSVVVALLTAIWVLPILAFWLVMIVTATIIVWFLPPQTFPFSLHRCCISIVVLMVIRLLMEYLGHCVSTSNIGSFLVDALCYPLLVTVFVVLTRYKAIFKLINPKYKTD